MPLHRAWEMQYHNDPYLRKLSVDDLLKRFADLTSVMTKDLPDGRMHINSDLSIAERYSHTIEEFQIRGLNYLGDTDEVLKTAHIAQPNSPKVLKALKKLANKSWPKSILVKFGTREHMASLFLEGKGRISLAATYDDPSLGLARSDDESLVSFYLHPKEAHRMYSVERLPNNGSRMVDLDVPFLGSVELKRRSSMPCYVYCMAEACDVRLFDDFTSPTSDVTACVVIKEPEQFIRRLTDAISKSLPGWQSNVGAVTYYDPFFVNVNDVVPFACKNFRFQYQKEQRFVCLQSKPEHVNAEKHVYFELGPLTDCADFIWLRRW